MAWTVAKVSKTDATVYKIAKRSSTCKTEMVVLWDPGKPKFCDEGDIERNLSDLDDPCISESRRECIRKKTGIKCRTVPLFVHSVYPYISFPLDIMHHCMNTCKGLMQIFKGRCVLLQTVIRSDDCFTRNLSRWDHIDSEMHSITWGTSHCVSRMYRVTLLLAPTGKPWNASSSSQTTQWYFLMVFSQYVISAICKSYLNC